MSLFLLYTQKGDKVHPGEYNGHAGKMRRQKKASTHLKQRHERLIPSRTFQADSPSETVGESQGCAFYDGAMRPLPA